MKVDGHFLTFISWILQLHCKVRILS